MKMKDRKFRIEKENCYSLLNMIFAYVENPLEKYLSLKDQEKNVHLDYIYKKEVVIQEDKLTLQILDLKKECLKKNLEYIPPGQFDRKILAIQQDIFNDNHPIDSYIKLCDTLNWPNDSLYMDVSQNLVVGLGEPNIVETSLTIHHTYGIPYIPAQAIKGMFRNYFVTKIIQDIDKPRRLDVCNKQINSIKLYGIIFGDILKKDNGQDTNQKGSVIFFDAFPIEKCTIDKDIMTPHYSSYYSSTDQFPRDTEQPVPITFYVVKDTTFAFHYGIRNEFVQEFAVIVDENNPQIEDCITLEELNSFIRENLKNALEVHGIGAKTSVGYGYMKNSEYIYNKKKDEMLRKKELEQQKIEEKKKADMSTVERLLYEMSSLPADQKKSEIPALLNNIDQWSEEEQKAIAKYVKKYLQSQEKWLVRHTSKSKGKKNREKVFFLVLFSNN